MEDLPQMYATKAFVHRKIKKLEFIKTLSKKAFAFLNIAVAQCISKDSTFALTRKLLSLRNPVSKILTTLSLQLEIELMTDFSIPINTWTNQAAECSHLYHCII